MREINEIPAEKFRFVTEKQQAEEILPGKHIGYFREAFGRFRKNKSSVVAGIIILCLVAYAVLVPIFCQTSYSVALTDTTYLFSHANA
jgi:oligopeptide transport system permease protein